MRLTLIIIYLALLQGCSYTSPTEMKSFSQSQIKCNSNEIEISNIRPEFFGGVNWIATCKGQNYVCHYEGNKKRMQNKAVMPEDCRKMPI